MDHHYSQSHGQGKDAFLSILSDDAALADLAKAKIFQQRKRGSLTPGVFLGAMMRAAQSGATSFLSIAVLCGIQIDGTLARQSLWGRINPRAFDFLSAVLCRLMVSRHQARQFLTRSIKRILVADSTIMRLHPSLEFFFPGSKNQHAKTSQSSARLQVLIDIFSGDFLHFNLSSFRRNDQAAAMDIISVIKKGDLLLRDLGYFTFSSLRAIHLIGEEELAGINAYGLYALRWRTENIFKAWESNLLPKQLAGRKTNAWHIKCLIVSQVIVMVKLSHLRIFAIPGKGDTSCEKQIAAGGVMSTGMSMFKILDIIMLCSRDAQTVPDAMLAKQLNYHAPYDKRKRKSLLALAIGFFVRVCPKSG